MRPQDLFDAESFLADQPYDELTALGYCREAHKFFSSEAGKFFRRALAVSRDTLVERIMENEDVSQTGLIRDAKMKAGVAMYDGLLVGLPPEIEDIEALCADRIKRAQN